MIVEVTHPDTGEIHTIDIPSLSTDQLDEMIKEHTTEKQIKSYIENLSIPADIKAILYKLANFTISVGNTVVKIGKKILEIAVMLVSKYKNATFGLIIGAMITFLIGSIPMIGALLASFLGPLIMLFGLGKGVWEDLKKDSPKISASIMDATVIFSPIQEPQAA